jgi:hypothetical protein
MNSSAAVPHTVALAGEPAAERVTRAAAIRGPSQPSRAFRSVRQDRVMPHLVRENVEELADDVWRIGHAQ